MVIKFVDRDIQSNKYGGAPCNRRIEKRDGTCSVVRYTVEDIHYDNNLLVPDLDNNVDVVKDYPGSRDMIRG